jgi:uncharacterized membrane protein YwzB
MKMYKNNKAKDIILCIMIMTLILTGETIANYLTDLIL